MAIRAPVAKRAIGSQQERERKRAVDWRGARRVEARQQAARTRDDRKLSLKAESRQPAADVRCVKTGGAPKHNAATNDQQFTIRTAMTTNKACAMTYDLRASAY